MLIWFVIKSVYSSSLHSYENSDIFKVKREAVCGDV